MEILFEAPRGVKTEGVRIDPLAQKAAEDILEIFDQLSIDPREMDFLKIPVVSAYVKGMQVLPHDTENIKFVGLGDQVHLVLARALASRKALERKKPSREMMPY